jgi:beta-1,4-mannosyl-glycoprotein beta-1,4-N-acetylglucosaminyltransferase
MLYDAFLFLNELELLEIRLHTLAPHVDRFVLVESNQTFSTLSSKGEFVFEQNRDAFREFLDKIIYVKLDDEFFTVEELGKRSWPTRLRHRIQKTLLADRNETHHRNSILRGLSGASPDDVVMISDVDEIINPACLPEAIALLRRHPVVAFEQTMYRYFLNNLEKGFAWTLPRVTTCREAFAGKPHTLRGLKGIPAVKNGGWHFSGVGGMEKFLYKIQSYLHHDRCYRGKYRDIEELEKIFEDRVIRQRIDLYDFMDSRYEFVEIDESYPAFIRENQERYGGLIYRAGE